MKIERILETEIPGTVALKDVEPGRAYFHPPFREPAMCEVHLRLQTGLQIVPKGMVPVVNIFTAHLSFLDGKERVYVCREGAYKVTL